MQVYKLNDLGLLRRHLAGQYALYELCEDLGGDQHWQSECILTDTETVRVPPRPPISSAKSFFFSEKENIFSFDGECFRETLPSPKPFVLFGVHSCDLTAIAYQDQFFNSDPYYQARRQQALLVGIDCISPCETGFCHVVNAGPGVKPECADLILHPTESKQWLLLASTGKGQNAIASMNLDRVAAIDLESRQQRIDDCIAQFEDHSHIEQGIQRLMEKNLPAQFWRDVGIQCLSCSGCTSLCPTCSCYGTRELGGDNNYSQQRFWDSCLYESFQREASNHNPSHLAGERLRRFWTHKFSPETQNQFGQHGCVGCGRCEQTCPGVIGAHSIMKRMVNYVEPNTTSN